MDPFGVYGSPSTGGGFHIANNFSPAHYDPFGMYSGNPLLRDVQAAKQNESNALTSQMGYHQTASQDFLNSLNTPQDINKAYKAGKITKDQFQQRLFQVQSPKGGKPGYATRGDILGGIGAGIGETLQGAARIVPEAAATAQQVVSPKKDVTYNSGPVGRFLFGNAPIQSIQVKGAQAAESHPGGFHIKGTPITLSPSQTGLAEVLGSLGIDLGSTVLPAAKGASSLRAGIAAGREGLTNAATRGLLQAGEKANLAKAAENAPINLPKTPPKPGALVKAPKGLLTGPSGKEGPGFTRVSSGPTLTPKTNRGLLGLAKGEEPGTAPEPKPAATPVKSQPSGVKATTGAVGKNVEKTASTTSKVEKPSVAQYTPKVKTASGGSGQMAALVNKESVAKSPEARGLKVTRSSEAAKVPKASKPSSLSGKVTGMIKGHAKSTYSSDLQRAGYELTGRKEAIASDVKDLAKEYKKLKLTPDELQKIQDYRDAKEAGLPHEELNSRLQEVDKQITELNKATFKALDERNAADGKPVGGHPNPETYLHREVKGKGTNLDQLVSGTRKSVGGVRSFAKTVGGEKKRVFHSVTDQEGNRHVVAIKSNRATILEDGGKKATDLGAIKKPKKASVIEYYDKNARDAIVKTADNLGIDIQKTLSRAGKYVGRTKKGSSEVELKAGAPTRVLYHEIGHKLDERYDLKGQFLTKKYNPELRKLADLRFEGEDGTTNGFKSYVRKGEEKMAVMMEAYIHAPQRFEEVAPKTFKAFQAFLKSHPETKPLTEIKPSLVLASEEVKPEELPNGVFRGKDGKVYQIGQATTKEIKAATGQEYYPHPVVNTLENYMKARNAAENVRFIENIKQHPDFKDIAAGPGEDAPKGWREVPGMMQLRGYKFRPEVAEVLHDVVGKGAMEPNLADQVGHVLQQAIVYFPLKHDFNMGVTYMVDRNLGLANPKQWRNLIRAYHDVTNESEFFRQIQKSGMNTMSSSNKEVAQFFQKELKALTPESPTIVDTAKAWGMKPVNLYRAVQRISVWELQDIMNVARVRDHMGSSLLGMRKGMSLEDAIKATERYNFQYRVPSRIGPKTLDRIPGGARVRRSSARMMNSPKLFFGRYAYDKYRIFGNILHDTVDLKSLAKTPGKNVEAAGKLAALSVGAMIVWPLVDKGIQAATGIPSAYMKAPGVLEPLSEANKVRTGQKNAYQAVTGQLFPSSAVEVPIEVLSNRDLFTGKPIWDTQGTFKDAMSSIVKYMGQNLGITQNFSNLTKGTGTKGSHPAAVAILALASARFPKNPESTAALSNLKYDSLVNFTQPQAKALAAKGDTQGAINIIKQYDDRVLKAAINAMKDQHINPPPQDQLIKELKSAGFWYSPQKSTIDSWTKSGGPKPTTLDSILKAKLSSRQKAGVVSSP